MHSLEHHSGTILGSYKNEWIAMSEKVYVFEFHHLRPAEFTTTKVNQVN